MTTINAVGNGLSGTTGTGNFVGSNSPTLVTPTIGAATATSLQFSPSTEGIIGTTAANNAASGIVGELIESVIPLASAVPLTTATTANVTSISLTAGDWDIFGNVTVRDSTLTPTIGSAGAWISLTSAPSLPDQSLLNSINVSGSATMQGVGIQCPYFRASISTTTTIFLCTQASFSGMNVNACGGIFARRVR